MTHLRNCGRCGNVCASRYCYEGACFTPPTNTDKCYPVDAVQNGDFSNGFANWTVSTISGTASSPDPEAGPATFCVLSALGKSTVSAS